MPVRHELRRQVRGLSSGSPWWAPADRLDPRSATVLGTLCAISLFDGYLGTLITQTMTYVADGFHIEGDRSQGVALAVVRIAIFLALPLAVTALWRSGLVPGFLPVVAVAAAAAPNIAPTWWLGFGINAVWMLALAWYLARIPLRAWFPGQMVEQPERSSQVLSA